MFSISTAIEKEKIKEAEKERTTMTKCELCECVARMYCESDQANLCWDCDEKVHRANFLVAKHSRSLLCHVCQSLTPWKASGPKLGPTVSVCDTCVTAAQCKTRDDQLAKPENQSERSTGDVDDLDETDRDGDYDDDDDDDDDEDEYDDLDVHDDEEDDENQVVPWSGDSQCPPPVPSSSCSSIEEEVSLKRVRHFSDFPSDDEVGCSSSLLCPRVAANEEANSSLSAFRPMKQARTRTGQDDGNGRADSRSTAVISSLQRLQNQMINDDGEASATILRICQLSRDESR